MNNAPRRGKLSAGLVNVLRKLGAEELARRAYYATVGSFVPKVKLVEGKPIAFFVSTPHAADSLYDLPEEQRAREWFLSHLREGDCVWDIGANIGMWTVPCAVRVGPSGRVVSFEPDPRVVRCLRRTVRRNHLTQVEICASAVSDREGEVRFFPGVDDLSLGSTQPRADGLPVGPERCVPCTTARAVAEKPELRPHAVKIDVEGAEGQVLDGFDEVAVERCRALALEVHPLLLEPMGTSCERLEARVRDLGFRIVERIPRTTIFIWLCERDV